MRSYADKRLKQLWLIFCMYEMRQNPLIQTRDGKVYSCHSKWRGQKNEAPFWRSTSRKFLIAFDDTESNCNKTYLLCCFGQYDCQTWLVYFSNTRNSSILSMKQPFVTNIHCIYILMRTTSYQTRFLQL